MNMPAIGTSHYRLLDHVPVGICIISHDYRIRFWNACLEDWTHLSRNDLIGKNILQIFPHLNESKYVCRLTNIFAGGPPTVFSSQLHKHFFPSPLPTGALRVQHTTVTSIPVDHESGYEAMIAVEDVTELTKRMHEYRLMRDRVLQEMEEREKAQREIKTLSGLLPICSCCKKIRDDNGYWNLLEKYVLTHSDAQFTHSICPDCTQILYPEIYSLIPLEEQAPLHHLPDNTPLISD